jgi:nicotinamidase-related amidase
MLLDKEHTGLAVIDVQDRLMQVMGQEKRVTKNISALLHLSNLYDLPVIFTEQYSKWLGSTVKQLRDKSPSYDPVQKMDFNCCAVDLFNVRLKEKNLKNIILTGIESHICIFQTCEALLERGYNVHIPRDAVDSRTEENWLVGIELMRKDGAVITSAETIIFQLLKRAGTAEFKEMLKIVK